MKILILNNRFPSDKKPFVASYVKTIGNLLSELGHEVNYLIDQRNSDTKIGQIVDLLRYRLKIRFSGRIKNQDILLVNHFHLFWDSLKPRVLEDQKLVIHWHGSEVKGSVRFQHFDKWKKDTMIRSASHVFPSRYYQSMVLDKMPWLQNLYVIPSGGIDVELFKKKENIQPREELVIGFASHLRVEKGVDFFMRLVKSLRRNHGQKRVVFKAIDYGDKTGEYRKSLESKGVLIQQPMSKERMPEYYNAVDVLVFPTRSESLGLVPLEAMACGVPVLCPDAFACPEYCLSGVSGELFAPDNYDSFEQKANLLISRLASYSPREIVLKNYTRRMIKKSYRDLLSTR